MTVPAHRHGGKYERSVLVACEREYALLLDQVQDQVLLDVGAHVGTVTLLALNAGAKHVICVEPVKASFDLLHQNIIDHLKRCTLYHAGITARPDVTKLEVRRKEDLTRATGAKTTWSLRLSNWRGDAYAYETVPAIQFSALLKRHQPGLIKLDCEGPEYEVFENLTGLPRHVKLLAVEWHRTQGRNVVRYLNCLDTIKRWGFRALNPPNVILRYRDNIIVGSNRRLVPPVTYVRE